MRMRYGCCYILVLVALLLVPPARAEEEQKSEAKKAETKSTVAVFRLEGDLKESPAGEAFPFDTGKTTSLKELVARLQKAREDKQVAAVVVTLESAQLGWAQIEELRRAIREIREAGKEVYAHSDSMDNAAYTLLSGVSRLSMVPTADLWLIGLYGESPYLHGLLTKVGVKPDFLSCGAYKSAAEMFMRKGPSPEAEQMQNWLLDSIFDTQLKLIAEGRRVTPEKARLWVDGGPYTAEKALEAGLIDAIEHRQDLVALLQEKFGENTKFDARYGAKKQNEIDFSSPFGALQFWSELLSGPKKKTPKTSVAVVYVDGPIMLGSAEASLFGGSEGAYSTTLRKALDEAAKDETIKAVVLRVDSPGGSAVASEIILDATRRVKAKKPIVVSMGNVAASGGYYVACGADTIFADEATITGSIGVVGGKLATTELWNKVGITWKAYQRGANAGLLSSASTFSESQRKRMQEWMDDIYGVFKGHVTAIRGQRLKKDIEELAGGRVFTGRQALELGLVDKIGSLDDAVAHIAAEAKLENYEVRALPEPKNFLELLLDGADDDDNSVLLESSPARGSLSSGLIEQALPMIKQLDPRRVESVLRSLRQLQTLEREGVVLMAPEFVVE